MSKSKIRGTALRHPIREGKALTPKQLGCLAKLVLRAITNYPNKAPTNRRLFKDMVDQIEPWERWLKTEIDSKVQDCDLPSYTEIGEEVEMLVEYYAYRHSLV